VGLTGGQLPPQRGAGTGKGAGSAGWAGPPGDGHGGGWGEGGGAFNRSCSGNQARWAARAGARGPGPKAAGQRAARVQPQASPQRGEPATITAGATQVKKTFVAVPAFSWASSRGARGLGPNKGGDLSPAAHGRWAPGEAAPRAIPGSLRGAGLNLPRVAAFSGPNPRGSCEVVAGPGNPDAAAVFIQAARGFAPGGPSCWCFRARGAPTRNPGPRQTEGSRVPFPHRPSVLTPRSPPPL